MHVIKPMNFINIALCERYWAQTMMSSDPIYMQLLEKVNLINTESRLVGAWGLC